jgi:hypothetical protein
MANQFASGKTAIAACDICGFRFKLKELRELVVKMKKVNLLACSQCWSPDHPQLQLGMFPIFDPQAIRSPRPDMLYNVSGVTVDGTLGGGTRIFAWGWAPVGGGVSLSDTPNPLATKVRLGTVTVVTT